MPLNEFHHRVAVVALSSAAKHGFALGGGSALIAQGIINRLTEDADLFTDDERGVRLPLMP
jgi:Nucleotidyl transferase AbiEii toxin, Type IV TA system